MKHPLKLCTKVNGETRYHFRNWSQKFVCPTCGRGVWKSLNFLGQRKLFCDGNRSFAINDSIGAAWKAGLSLQEWVDAQS